MRVATYTRISTDEVNQPYSLGAQSERLAAYMTSQEDWSWSEPSRTRCRAPSSIVRD